MMTLRVANITFDCDDTLAVAEFWAAAVGRPIDEGASEWFARIALWKEVLDAFAG